MPRPNTNFAALRRILQQELSLGKSLVMVAEAVSEAIIAGDAPLLASLEQQQKRLLDQQDAQETARQQVTRELAWRLGLDRSPTLSVLLPSLPLPEAIAMDALRKQLLKTQAKLESLNQQNRRLLENALEYVKFSLDLLTTTALKPARYGTNLTQLAAPSFYIDSKA